MNRSYRYGNQVEYGASQFGYSMYGGGNYETDSMSRKLEGGSKWVEFDKSPDTEKTLVNESENLSFDNEYVSIKYRHKSLCISVYNENKKIYPT